MSVQTEKALKYQGCVSVGIVRIKAFVHEDHEPFKVRFSKMPGSCISSERQRCTHNFGGPSQGSSPLGLGRSPCSPGGLRGRAGL